MLFLSFYFLGWNNRDEVVEYSPAYYRRCQLLGKGASKKEYANELSKAKRKQWLENRPERKKNDGNNGAPNLKFSSRHQNPRGIFVSSFPSVPHPQQPTGLSDSIRSSYLRRYDFIKEPEKGLMLNQAHKGLFTALFSFSLTD